MGRCLPVRVRIGKVRVDVHCQAVNIGCHEQMEWTGCVLFCFLIYLCIYLEIRKSADYDTRPSCVPFSHPFSQWAVFPLVSIIVRILQLQFKGLRR